MRKILPLLSFILVVSMILPISLSALSFEDTTAFSVYDSDFDYSAVMSEPTLLPTSGARALSKAELRSLKLYPGGIPFGVKFMTDGVLIVGSAEVINGSKKENPSSAAGLKTGDRILSVNGKALRSAEDLTRSVESSNGDVLSIVYMRNGAKHSTTLKPAYSSNEGCYKTGLYVKDNGAGIGTVTYIDPASLSFAGLGHGICESDGALVPIQRGSVVGVNINGVIKGQKGVPGEVKGYFSSGKVGSLLQNTNCGVFGIFASLPKGLPSQPLSLCLKDELREGKAHIWCTLDGDTPRKYEVEISSIDLSASEGKCFTVKVKDPALLEKTGGIVQGMSGSPIIQNGKLVGAVTHVLINDPTTGYGIFIENMLAAEEKTVMPRAA